MPSDQQLEDLINLVAAMDRSALADHFRALRRDFPFDFSEAFLTQQPLERLQHLYLAICLQHPTAATSAAAA